MTNIRFMLEAAKHFKTIGSPIPSQKFLVEKMVEQIQPEKTKCIIELGAGEGSITKSILPRIKDSDVLLSFEINKKLSQQILPPNFKATNVHVINDDVLRLTNYLDKYGIEKIDYLISSLPLAQISDSEIISLLSNIKNHMKPSSLFIQYQYSLQSFSLLKRTFDNVEVSFTPLNFPPAFVYTCRK